MTLKITEKYGERVESLRQKYPWVGEMADEAEREFAAMERDQAAGMREAVVRCRDCKYGKAVSEVGCILLESRGAPLKDPDGFCAWGRERGR